MAKCVVENCTNEGGRTGINFKTDRGLQYKADVSICMGCWKHLKEARGQASAVLFRPADESFIDYDGVRRKAYVKSIQFKEESHV